MEEKVDLHLLKPLFRFLANNVDRLEQFMQSVDSDQSKWQETDILEIELQAEEANVDDSVKSIKELYVEITSLKKRIALLEFKSTPTPESSVLAHTPDKVMIERDALNVVIEENEELKESLGSLKTHAGLIQSERSLLKVREKNLCGIMCCSPEGLEEVALGYLSDLRELLQRSEKAEAQVAKFKEEIELRKIMYREQMSMATEDPSIPAAAAQKKLDEVYAERNMLVSLLSKVFPSYLGRHPEEEEWDDDWRWMVVVSLPTPPPALDEGGPIWVQVIWHIHDSHQAWFPHLRQERVRWDGHTTEEKYRRVLAVKRNAMKEVILDDVITMLERNPLPFCVGNSCAKDCATAVELVRDGDNWRSSSFHSLLLDKVNAKVEESK